MLLVLCLASTSGSFQTANTACRKMAESVNPSRFLTNYNEFMKPATTQQVHLTLQVDVDGLGYNAAWTRRHIPIVSEEHTAFIFRAKPWYLPRTSHGVTRKTTVGISSQLWERQMQHLQALCSHAFSNTKLSLQCKRLSTGGPQVVPTTPAS
jgi:hypothetical protein